NARGDYTNGNVFASDTAKLRSAIIEAALTPSDEAAVRALGESNDQASPELLAWLPAEAPAARALVQPSIETEMRHETLLRVPVQIQGPASGEKVKIDGAFCRIVLAPGVVPPYDINRREWASSPLPGQWLIGFAPPPQLGRLKPLRVTLLADVTAPQQTI